MTRPSSMRQDILTAYVAAGSRLASWIIVTAVVYRRLGVPAFAVLALVRTTIGLLNYATLGLAPATVRMMAVEQSSGTSEKSQVFSSSALLALISGLFAAALATAYALLFDRIHRLPPTLAATDFRPFVAAMGLGTAFRLMSDPFGAVLQVRGRIALDNLLLAAAEFAWLALCLLFIHGTGGNLDAIGWAWFVSGLALAAARANYASRALGRDAFSLHAARAATMRRLLAFGLLVALAQAADFLYAPTDNILINRFVDPLQVAVYAPAIQIDAGLLLLVGGAAAVLLPRSALAHAQNDLKKLRTYYFNGTLITTLLLAIAAITVWLVAAPIFHLWLNNPLTATQAILPLVLIHTVVGGSSAVGRSVLLAMGKVRPFTIAVLFAGASNVLLSFAFVYFCRLGLRGIVLGTIAAVVGRCAVWTPWYVLKTLRANG